MTFKELVDKYKLLDRDGKKPYNPIYSSVGEGWVPILDRAFKEASKVEGWDKCIAQIKEKFGTLCLYWSARLNISYEDQEYNKKLTKIFTKAEHESYTVCEDCGKTGKRVKVRGSWLRTLCKTCEDMKIVHNG